MRALFPTEYILIVSEACMALHSSSKKVSQPSDTALAMISLSVEQAVGSESGIGHMRWLVRRDLRPKSRQVRLPSPVNVFNVVGHGVVCLSFTWRDRLPSLQAIASPYARPVPLKVQTP